MSSVSPIHGITENKQINQFQLKTAEPVFRAFNLNTKKSDSAEFKKDEAEEKKKRNIPWKKIGAGIALAVIFIEFNLRRDPRRKYLVKDYEKLFSNTTGTEIRDFSMIPYREEIIIKEAANGSKKANEMLPELSCNGEKIKKYIQLQRKIESGRKNYIEGRYEEYSTDTCTSRQIQKSVLKGLDKLQKEANSIYKQYIEPLCKT